MAKRIIYSIKKIYIYKFTPTEAAAAAAAPHSSCFGVLLFILFSTLYTTASSSAAAAPLSRYYLLEKTGEIIFNWHLIRLGAILSRKGFISILFFNSRMSLQSTLRVLLLLLFIYLCTWVIKWWPTSPLVIVGGLYTAVRKKKKKT